MKLLSNSANKDLREIYRKLPLIEKNVSDFIRSKKKPKSFSINFFNTALSDFRNKNTTQPNVYNREAGKEISGNLSKINFDIPLESKKMMNISSLDIKKPLLSPTLDVKSSDSMNIENLDEKNKQPTQIEMKKSLFSRLLKFIKSF
jgi:hypothetical protein